MPPGEDFEVDLAEIVEQIEETQMTNSIRRVVRARRKARSALDDKAATDPDYVDGPEEESIQY